MAEHLACKDSKAVAQSMASATMRILVVEDEADLLSSIAQALR